MAKEITVAGVQATLENIPGSAITRVRIAGLGSFAYHPDRRCFSVFGDLGWTPVALALPEPHVAELLDALQRHTENRLR